MADLDETTLRRRNRRVGLALLGGVALLVASTFAYVGLYDRFLRDPDTPPSVHATQPRVVAFEVALASGVVLALGVALNFWLRRSRRRR
jgi:hypothetical protein